MSKKGRSNPKVYRTMRGLLSQRFLLREPFDNLLEQTGAVEQIATLWAAQYLLQKRARAEGRASDSEAPEDFQSMEARRDYIRQRLPDRLYWAAVLTVVEADLGRETPRDVIEDWEKGTALLGRRDEWLPKQGRPQGAKTAPSAERDEKEETRRNQVLDAFRGIYQESPELERITWKALARKIGRSPKTLSRWREMYKWDLEVLEFEALRSALPSGHGK